MSNTSTWPIGTTTPGQSGAESNGKRVLQILQSSSITGASLSDCLVSCPGHSLRVLTLCKDAVCIFYSPSWLEQDTLCGLTVSKLDWQTYTSEFESHWVPYSYGLVPYLSKNLSKLLQTITPYKAPFMLPNNSIRKLQKPK